jgi:hypothetical protein
VRLRTPTILKLLAEVNSSVKGETAILVQIDIERLEVSRSIDNTDLACLDKVICDNQVLLVRRDLDIVRSYCGLVLIWIIETFDVVQVADVQRDNVVCCGKCGVEEAAVLTDVGAVDA